MYLSVQAAGLLFTMFHAQELGGLTRSLVGRQDYCLVAPQYLLVVMASFSHDNASSSARDWVCKISYGVGVPLTPVHLIKLHLSLSFAATVQRWSKTTRILSGSPVEEK